MNRLVGPQHLERVPLPSRRLLQVDQIIEIPLSRPLLHFAYFDPPQHFDRQLQVNSPRISIDHQKTPLFDRC